MNLSIDNGVAELKPASLSTHHAEHLTLVGSTIEVTCDPNTESIDYNTIECVYGEEEGGLPHWNDTLPLCTGANVFSSLTYEIIVIIMAVILKEIPSTLIPLKVLAQKMTFTKIQCCKFHFTVSTCEDVSSLREPHGTITPSTDWDNLTDVTRHHGHNDTSTTLPHFQTTLEPETSTSYKQFPIYMSLVTHGQSHNGERHRRSEELALQFVNGSELSLLCDTNYFGSQKRFAICKWNETTHHSRWEIDQSAACIGNNLPLSR